MDGRRARPLMRGVVALALAVSLAVAGACGPVRLQRRAREIDYGIKLDRRGFGIRRPGRHARREASPGALSGRLLGQHRQSLLAIIPASKWVYRETDTRGTNQKVVVEVTDETKMIANGIEARVIRDTVTENGAPVEITDDWYAQDKAGNIWYLGEDVTNYKNGKVVGHGGSFEAGVDGAQPGIAMPILSRALLPPGVLQGRSRGQGRGHHHRRRTGPGAPRLFRPWHPDDA